MTEKLFAFVLMPFEASFDDIYRLGIKATAEKADILAERVDEQIFHNEKMLERIYNQINVSDFIIADMTGRNPNVFYEVGYAHAKGKTCLLLTQNAEDIPFDLKHHRHIIYGNSIQVLIQKLLPELQWIYENINQSRQKPIDVVLHRTKGSLEKDKWSATADVTLYIDMHNKTDSHSAEIESIYLYTGAGWKFKQDGRECHSTVSDVETYKLRHFIHSPIRRLQRGAWAQLKLEGRKMVASVFDGDELRDNYKIIGKTDLKIITSGGEYYYTLNIDVEVDDIPF
jgi:hypothetical protein